MSELCYLEDAESQAIVDEVLKQRKQQVEQKTIKLHPLRENLKSILETEYIAFDDPQRALNLTMAKKTDFLHNGHKRLLTMAAIICSQE